MSSYVINANKEIQHLYKLAKQDSGKRFTKLWRIITSKEWLEYAWNGIRENKGSQTPGIDNTTGIDITNNRIQSLSKRLKEGTYKPKAVRRTYIPKSNGKTRPLGIPTIEDRIVQQGLRLVLEPIFEADFLQCSHGFRKGRSTHTALHDVVIAYTRTSWIIEGDIVGCFDSIPHEKLMGAVSKRIADEKVLRIIRLFLKAGYMEDWVHHRTYSGTPQGGIISPLLCNIFLHQLDEYLIQDLGANRTQGKEWQTKRVCKEYQRLSNKIARTRTKHRKAIHDERKVLTKELKRLERTRAVTPVYSLRHPCKIGYVRYADDFLIMINGTKAEAETLKDNVKDKLSELGLTLSEEKTKLTHWHNTVQFLGYNIRGRMRKKGQQIIGILSIPKEKSRRFKKEVARVCSWHHIPEIDATKQVSAMFRGWCNYYRYASAPQKVFSRISFHTWWLFAHYLARRHKTNIAKTIKRFKTNGLLKRHTVQGRSVQTFHIPNGNKFVVLNIVPPPTKSIHKVWSAKSWEVDYKYPIFSGWTQGRSEATRELARQASNGKCQRCYINPIWQVHHPKPMKGKTHLSKVRSDEAQRERAVALCKECHLAAHK